MTEGSSAASDPRTSTDSNADFLRDPRYLEWMDEHIADLRRSIAGQRMLYWSLALGFAVGLAAHVAGYLIRSGAPGEPLALLADLLYAAGFALWTGVVVALFIQVIPDVKRRQIRSAIEAYDAVVRSKHRSSRGTHPGGDLPKG
jgi:hypothetical protein